MSEVGHRGATAPPQRQRSAWEIQRTVLFALLLRELKTRFGGRWLGAVWVLAEPLAHVLLVMLILGYWRHRLLPGLDYVMFLVTGLLPFFMFKSLALRLMEAIDANRGLFGYRQLRPMDALVSRAALEIGLYSLVYLAVLVLMAWFGLRVLPDRPLELIAVSTALLAGGFGTGLVLAVLTDDLPQARGLVRITFFPLYLVSGVVFPVNTLPSDVLPWLLWNPLLHALEVSRGYYFNAYQPLVQANASVVGAFALLTLGLGLSLYRVRRQRLIAL
jgi:capsular polysaccharide transport system permease protein